MRPIFYPFTALLTIALLAIPALPASAQSPTKKSLSNVTTPLSGIYQGKIAINAAMKLTLVFTIKPSATGDQTATLSVPEQGGKSISVTKTTITDDTVTFALDLIGASFTGKRDKEGKMITGTFTQGGMNFPLVLEKTTVAAVPITHPQEPKPPFPYTAQDVTYDNTKATGVTLAGTLLVPPGKGPFPVVLFITGSGLQNRDEEIMGHKPFLVIADYLARHGIASLRVDDRGAGKSTGDPTKATSADFADDTRAGVAYLKTRTDVVDPKRIGLIGHSEGGMIAPMVASGNPDVSFIVLLAGPGVSGDKVLLEQQVAVAKAMGISDTTQSHTVMTKFYNAVTAEKDPALIPARIHTVAEELIAPVPEASRPQAKKQIDTIVDQLTIPWIEYFLRYDPAPTLRSVKCPVLALNGSKDLQVLPQQNLPAIEQALKAGGNTDVTIHEIPGLNHLFQHTATGSPAEYATISETFAPEVLTILGDWITAHTEARP